MSRNRDKNADRAATRRLMQSKSGATGGSLNWLGHRLESGAAKIDQLLLAGASMDQLARCRGAVHEHLEHLSVEHGLTVLATAGVYRFSFEGSPIQRRIDDSPKMKIAKRPEESRDAPKNAKHATATDDRPIREAKASFDDSYIAHASRVFVKPKPTYPWCDIVSGVAVCLRKRSSERMWAVSGNTFRGFHRINASLPGAKDIYVDYFVQNRDRLAKLLRETRNRDGLHRLSNQIVDELRLKLTNVKPDMLRAYNRLRKPIDLYFEHLVAMADEFNEVRERLIPLLYLPLDSQIFASPAIFNSGELEAFGLTRESTFGMIRDEDNYLALQRIVDTKAAEISQKLEQKFHPIFFDLVWGNRWKSDGTNLFMTNAGGD